ncbi:MAG TPA: polymer-forming cytoskeletal protein [Hyphomicrobium sp.]
MEDKSRVLIIREDTFLKGEIRNAGRIEVFGYVEGDIAADLLIVQPGGRCFGKVKVDSADVRGQLQGDVLVRQLISIRGTGEVTGNVKYGRLSMELGGLLTAEMRNIPPSISGDLDLSVDKGRAVRITLQDLSALDPDDTAEHLTFTVSQVRNGFVALATDPARPVDAFTQADLEQGTVLFRHDGTDEPRASFAVVVADRAGATSGAAQTVNVAVR